MTRNTPPLPIHPGRPDPLGPSVTPTGVHFSLYAQHADSVDLLLFDGASDPGPAHTLTLDPAVHRTGSYWHLEVTGIGHGQVYAWRVRGPHAPDQGHRFDGDKVLLDPYGRAVTGLDIYDRHAARARGDNQGRCLRSVVVDNSRYDWQNDRPLPAPVEREFIYEMHLAGFTASPTCDLDDSRRGTYAGLIRKIPYLLELGVNTVELLPVHQFDPQDAPAGRTNVWGYSSLSFFAPHAGYSTNQSPAGCVDEFRDMVKALHRAGIRIILDVVYNHTAEGGADGPVLSWRGIDNGAYYILQKDRSSYADYTGCGNTLNANQAVSRRLVLDSLRYWVRDMHVDGFRFDLASAMSRGEDGQPLPRPPVLWHISSDPVLAGSRLIAEAWDAAGLYQVGNFPGGDFAQWNDRFRDDVRRFLRGDDGTIEALMARIVGSPDVFAGRNHRASHSINYVTCHDGFSLADLVSYRHKHNLDNGEDNRDGSDQNLSCNHGVEGPTGDPEIQSLRRRQMRNFLTLLFLSHGTPMLRMGDEIGQTRRGNNNTWCQDNELNWLDWQPDAHGRRQLDFTRGLVALSRSLPLLQDDHFWTATSPAAAGEITWHGTGLDQPDWTPGSHQLAYTLEMAPDAPRLHVMLNSSPDDLEFEIPKAGPGRQWIRVVATGQGPDGFVSLPGEGHEVVGNKILVPTQSITALLEIE